VRARVEDDAFERRVDQRAGDAAVDRRVQLRVLSAVP
jgi:hypothetical protein